MEQLYAQYATEQATALIAIDSPTGYTKKAAEWVQNAFASLGFSATITNKGGVLVDLGGLDKNDAILFEAHADTLGAMVAEVKGNGRLRLAPLGGMRADNGETENVRVYTRDGKVIEGTLQLTNASVHVNPNYSSASRSFDTTEVVLDEAVSSAADARALGIENGDIVACLVDGESATVKRFSKENRRIVLSPENEDYAPIQLSPEDFEIGRARILGVAIEAKTKF